MDYQAEQEQELEILTSIYDEDEFERTTNSLIGPLTPPEISPIEYRIRVIPDTDKPDPRIHSSNPPN